MVEKDCFVDCVALDAVEELDGLLSDPNSKKVADVYPTCMHPDRGGPKFGCVMIDFDTGELTGEKCIYQAPEGSAEAERLERFWKEQQDSLTLDDIF